MNPIQQKSLFCCSLTLLLFTLTAYTQINITGRIVDEKDDSPLEGASVYFNNTTIGTYTNQEGFFYFEAISLLNTELVISCPGYELLLYKPTAGQVEKKRIIFKLREKVASPENKLIVTEADRKRLLDIFHKNFLGITKEAAKCTISNEQNIYFTRGNSSSSFMVYADTPLVVINNMLGYKISFNLVEFSYDEATGQDYLDGYTRYEELGNDKKWIKNRQRCYYGSSVHFYRSLISNQLYEQGFGTFLLQPVTTDSIQKSLLNSEQVKAAASILTAVPITAQQILYIDTTNNFQIRVKGKLLVQYSRDPSSKEFLKRNIYIAGDLEKGVESIILFKDSPIGINNSGVLSDATNVEYSGYWIYEKAANLLPYNYRPE
jgi:CarboxypepD_reg-like domain